MGKRLTEALDATSGGAQTAWLAEMAPRFGILAGEGLKGARGWEAPGAR